MNLYEELHYTKVKFNQEDITLTPANVRVTPVNEQKHTVLPKVLKATINFARKNVCEQQIFYNLIKETEVH